MADGARKHGVRSRLRQSLVVALKARDPIAVAALRSVLGANDNAEVADLSHAPAIQQGVIAGGVRGLGAGEVPRRELSEAQIVEIILAEIAEWQAVATAVEHAGGHDHATRLRAETAVLTAFLRSREPPSEATGSTGRSSI
jgi:uncharacterized protein YqeY